MRISDWSSDVCSSDLCEVAALLCAEIQAIRYAEAGEGANGTTLQGGGPILLDDIEGFGLQRLVGARIDSLHATGFGAGLIVVADQFETRSLGFPDLTVQRNDSARHIVEDRFELLMEERQPVFHALMLAALE